MKKTVFRAMVMIIPLLSACSQSSDSCEDLEGTITHTTTELTGIDSVSVIRRASVDGVEQAVDQINGTEFSNLSIEISLSWTEEQHRFRANNTIIQSALNWFISPSVACSLVPYYEEYQPGVSNIEILSDSDLSDELIAGQDLSRFFTTTEISGDSGNLVEANENFALLSARQYSLTPAWKNGRLIVEPTVPKTHVFSILFTLSDGRVFEKQTPAVLISGI